MRLQYFAGVRTVSDAQARYHELAQELHPDRNPENSSAFVTMRREYEHVLTALQLQGATQPEREERPQKKKKENRTDSGKAGSPAFVPVVYQPPPTTLSDTAKELGRQLITGLAVAAIEKIVEHVNKK